MFFKNDSPAIYALGVFATSLVMGCATPTGPTAKAQLEPTKGNTVTGVASFESRGDRVLVKVDVKGLAPNTVHGLHIHEKGDCSSGDGMSAGGHFNPTHAAHGAHDGAVQHAGDLPSLKADALGNASLSLESNHFSVGSGDTNIVGRSLIVHRDPDDFATQPTGNSGARIACGVIR